MLQLRLLRKVNLIFILSIYINQQHQLKKIYRMKNIYNSYKIPLTFMDLFIIGIRTSEGKFVHIHLTY
jgi:hypothetical protein